MRILVAALAGAVTTGLVAVPATSLPQRPTDTDWPGGAPVETLPLTAGIPIPLRRVQDLAYDEANDRLLIIGTGDQPLVVADADGRIEGPVPGIDEASRMLLDHAGDVLYLSQPGRNRILELDRRSLEVTRTFDTGVDRCPLRLGLTQDVLWFSDNKCDGHYSHQVGAVDLTTGEIHTDIPVDGTTWRPLGSYPEFASTGSRPDEMVVASSSDQHYRVRAIRTPTPRLTILAQRTVFATRQLAYDVDGESVVLGSHNGGSQLRLDADTLEQVAAYPTGDRPTSLAFGPDGTFAAGNEGQHVPDVFVFGPGRRPTAHRIYDFGENRAGSYQYLAPRGIAVGEGSVYAVKVDGYGSNPRLLTLDTRVRPRLRLTAPMRVLASGARAPVRVQLGPELSDQQVQVVMRPLGARARARVVVVRTDRTGSATVQHVFGRTTLVRAEVPRDGRAERAVAEATVRTRPRLSTWWANGNRQGAQALLAPGVQPVLRGRVTPQPQRGFVSVDTRYIHPATSRLRALPTRWRVPVRADGTFRVQLPLPGTRRPTRLQARVRVAAAEDHVRAVSVWRRARLIR